MVVDDDEINRFALRAMLTKRAVAVEEASSGPEAVRRAAEHAFVLIFMDCHMPEMDGCSAAAQVRANGASRHAAIVAVTADDTLGNQARCRRAGMNDFLVKPVRGRQLDQVITRWLPPPPGPF